jgi:hypothetical protein
MEQVMEIHSGSQVKMNVIGYTGILYRMLHIPLAIFKKFVIFLQEKKVKMKRGTT